MAVSETKIAKVPGVLQGSSDIREEMLRRIFWEDKEYTKYGNGIVKYAEITDKIVSPVTEGLSLYEYTHGNLSDYSRKIRVENLQKHVPEEVYTNGTYEHNLHKWEGDYFYEFTENNELEHISNVKFSEQVSVAAVANYDRALESKYITPSLIGFYGSNPRIDEGFGGLSTLKSLGGIYKHGTGRIADIPEANISLKRGNNTKENARDNNNGVSYLEDMLWDKYSTIDFPKYVEFYWAEGNPRGVFDYTKTIVGDESNFDEANVSFDGFGLSPTISNGDKEWTSVDDVVYITQDEGDKGYESALDFSEPLYDYDKNTEEYDGAVDGSVFYTNTNLGNNNLLAKTTKLFNQHKISTLIGRFHTSSDNGLTNDSDTTDSAKDYKYGNSHGRNLLKKKAHELDYRTNGYENPYCRVWTYHHEYDKVSRQIRPFENYADTEGAARLQELLNKGIRSYKKGVLNGGKYLADNTVLNNENGRVNIAPSKESKVEVKKCMFSLENLAWKDVPKNQNYLSKEQIGPNGGRIMWFPPYDLDFSESVNVDWDGSTFIGRGEKVYTYKNTDRTGTLSFVLLIDHPGVIDVMNSRKIPDDGESHYDILRFFAGCGPLELKEEPDLDGDKLEVNDPVTTEPKPAPNETKTEKVKFYVYFPNNYSGNGAVIGKDAWEQAGYSDPDWYYYVLLGKGTTIDSSPAYWKGYEVSNGGLGNAENVIRANPKVERCTQWEHVTEVDKNPNNAYNYRVDFDLRQVLYNTKNESYIDNSSWRLNCELEESISVGANYSFAEVMIALLQYSNDENSLKGNGDGTFSQSTYNINEVNDFLVGNGADSGRIKHLIELFKNGTLVSTWAKGSASQQDDSNRTGCTESNAVMLAKRRRKSILEVLKRNLEDIHEIEKDKPVLEVPKHLTTEEMQYVNLLKVKADKYAVVEMTFNPPETKDVEEANNQGESVEESADNEKTLIEDNVGMPENDVDADTNTEIAPNVLSANSSIDGKAVKTRYETESEYFKNLSKSEPFVYKNLVNKFKYFTPAFHSISPEGFNARLTFLHQCTRQGHTIEASDRNGYSMTAGNLAFGRMPVCVLRIGDFLNTRIIIQSMTISYSNNGITWDLNPEGIGVQPMYAKISMQIVILGGQSLSGPISRLQNAVSFNYYANTGVYDDRSDVVELMDSAASNGEIRTEIEGNTTTSVIDRSEYSSVKENYINLWAPYPTTESIVDNN